MPDQALLFEVPQVERKLGPIERAVTHGTDVEAINAVLEKCARIMDESDSGRDVKALSVTIIDGISKRHELTGGSEEGSEVTPLDVVRGKARRVAGA